MRKGMLNHHGYEYHKHFRYSVLNKILSKTAGHFSLYPSQVFYQRIGYKSVLTGHIYDFSWNEFDLKELDNKSLENLRVCVKHIVNFLGKRREIKVNF